MGYVNASDVAIYSDLETIRLALTAAETANQLLDEIFEPFANPVYPNNLLHIVAINSGKLLEWISTQPTTNYLAQQLRNILLGTSIH
ncbi:hypothetical protein TI04_10715, partial [Achromatium sp. WMS2]